MERLRFERWILGMMLLLATVSGGGCARLPRIDPSGERIFLPPSATPPAGASESILNPVFTPGSVPPPCDPLFAPPNAAPVPVAATAPALPAAGRAPLLQAGRAGALQVTPARVVAPIGSEVVLLSGLRGADGQFVPRQPLEWILSQESVGHFVAVEDGGYLVSAKLLQRKPRKLANNYAVGRTSPEAEVIDRGTATTGDDVWVQAGQSWISLTSPTEGSSHVSVVAPEATSWDLRRQTATVHWIDAQWTLPPTTIGSAGQQQLLTTTVTRASNGSPITGWIVRYEIVDTSAAAVFAPSGGLAAEVVTDAAGSAVATLMPSANAQGSVQIQIQIIRPAQQSGDLPRLVVGTGWTSVTWNAPGLAVQVTGPEAGGIDSLATYRIDVTNPGAMTARGVTISGTASTGLEFLNSEPVGRPFGNQLEWRIDELAAGATGTIVVNCRVKQKGTLSYCAKATSDDGLSAEHCAQTRVFVPSLSVKMSGPDQVNVGDKAEFEVEITNQGDSPLADVVLIDDFDPGLRHVAGGASPIRKVLDEPLAPGQSAFIKLIFDVDRPGQLCHTLTVQAAGGHEEVRRSCVTAVDNRPAARPAVETRITGPAQQQAGQTANYVLEVVNTGNVALTNVQVSFTFSPSLFPAQATDGHQWREGGLVWNNAILRLEPGQRDALEVVCNCLQEDAAATARVAVSCDQAATDSATTSTRIVARQEQPDVGPPPMDNDQNVPVTGDLRVSVVDQADPIRVGETTTYLITIKNDRNVSDKNVIVKLLEPEGMKVKQLRTSSLVIKNAPLGGPIELTPIKELRAGETFPVIRVDVTGQRPGKYAFRVQLTSQRSAQVEAMAETTVVP